MQSYNSKLLQGAVDAIASLPGVGRKSALRLALYLLSQSEEKVTHFTESIQNFRTNIHFCPRCSMISDSEGLCEICADSRRDASIICIVESIRDVMSIEKTGEYHGLYHVLGGIISPLNGVGPEDLNIATLVKRCHEEVPSEVIFALSSDIEGETTALYIYRKLSDLQGLRFSTLARGIGFGDDLEYADEITLGRSIAARAPYKI